jgi:DNA-binding SARP family transcriptional activator
LRAGALASKTIPSSDAPARPATHLTISLLNGFLLKLEEQEVLLPLACQRLLALLAFHDRPVLRTFVAGTLWPEFSEERAAACLRSTLWRLHRPAADAVAATSTQMRLSLGVRVDVREAIGAARRLVAPGNRPRAADLDEALLSEDILPDWHDEWVIVERERFRQLRLHGLERICLELAARGRYAEAVQAGVAAVTGEPLRESAHRALIQAHLAEGNRFEAVRAFHSFRRLLQQEMGLEPTNELKALVQPYGV